MPDNIEPEAPKRRTLKQTEGDPVAKFVKWRQYYEYEQGLNESIDIIDRRIIRSSCHFLGKVCRFLGYRGAL